MFNSRTYVLSEDLIDKVWLVDCGDIDKVNPLIGDSIVEGVLLTHTHSDHIYGLNQLLTYYPCVRIVTNAYGYDALASPKLNISRYHSDFDDIALLDRRNVEIVSDGQQIDVLGNSVLVYETPGHDPSCLCYRIEKFFFTGDSYIPGVKVFSGFPYSDKSLAQSSLDRIIALSEGLQIFPGHEI